MWMILGFSTVFIELLAIAECLNNFTSPELIEKPNLADDQQAMLLQMICQNPLLFQLV